MHCYILYKFGYLMWLFMYIKTNFSHLFIIGKIAFKNHNRENIFIWVLTIKCYVVMSGQRKLRVRVYAPKEADF